MWDEEDGFFYDVLRLPDGAQRLKVRSHRRAAAALRGDGLRGEARRASCPSSERVAAVPRHTPRAVRPTSRSDGAGMHGRRLLSIVNEEQLRRVLARCSTRTSFSVPMGSVALPVSPRPPLRASTPATRSIASGTCRRNPTRGMFGGNSNWRGPVWMPVNLCWSARCCTLRYYGDGFTVECPTGLGHHDDAATRSRGDHATAARIFMGDSAGGGRSSAAAPKFQAIGTGATCCSSTNTSTATTAPAIGASHQTGWTGLIASLLHFFATEVGDGRSEPLGRRVGVCGGFARMAPGSRERRSVGPEEES